MNLDELSDAFVKEELEEEEFDEDTDDGVEENLSCALAILEDCWALMEDVLDTKNKRKVPNYLYEKLQSLSQETFAFLHQYQAENGEEVKNKVEWWEKGEF